MKTCARCKLTLEDEQFYKHPKGKGGLGSNCKECIKQYSADRYDKIISDPDIKKKVLAQIQGYQKNRRILEREKLNERKNGKSSN